MMSASMLEGHPGRDAVAQIAHVLARQPSKDDQALSVVTRYLTAFREELIQVARGHDGSDEDRERLSRLNAIISVVMAMHFPLGNPPWDEFRKAQTWLEALVREIEP